MTMVTGPPLLPLSVCFIARDEERDLPGAIASVPFARQIVLLLDARSLDRSEDAARAALGPGQELVVARREWDGHVAQKRAALALAGQDWVLCLDADERVSPELRDEILARFLPSPPESGVDGYTCPRLSFYLGRWIRHSGWYPDRKLRLARRARGRWVGSDPHDRLEVEGRVGELRGDILHFTYRDLADHLDKMDDYTAAAALKLDARGVGWLLPRLLIQPAARFLKSYVLKAGFLDGEAGLVIATLGAYYVFLKYARVWELRRDRRWARSHGAVRAAPPAGAEHGLGTPAQR